MRNLRSLGVKFVACAFMVGMATCSRAAYTDPSLSVIVGAVATPTVNQPIVVFAGVGTSAVLTATPTNFTPTSYTWTQVQDISNSFATTGTSTFTNAQSNGQAVQATLPAKGIYQFQVTATDGFNTAARYVWVNVWDANPAMGPNHMIGGNPGVNPPTSVQPLSRDPGPFCHPRIFFSRADWSALNAKDLPPTGSNPVPDASAATTFLQTSLANHFDKTGDPLNQLAVAFETYSTSGYSSSALSNLNSVYAANLNSLGRTISGNALGGGTDGSFYDALSAACYLAWIGTDPNLAHNPSSAAGQRFTYLANIVAASANYETYTSLYGVSGFSGDINNHPKVNIVGLNGNGIDSGNYPLYAHNNLAVAYDYIYDWLSTPQQADCISYLFLAGNIYNNGGGGYQRNAPPVAPSANTQNEQGDFPDLADGILLPEMAIEGEEGKVNSSVTAVAVPNFAAPVSAATWPNANNVSVLNMQRQIHANSEFRLTTWGMCLHMFDYFQFCANVSGQGTFALSRRGENQWVTTNLYQSFLHALYNLSARESDGTPALFDHHDGSGFAPGSNSNIEMMLAKYMYPTDPMVDYVYHAYWVEDSSRQFLSTNGNDTLAAAMFSVPALNSGTWTLNAVATNKGLNLTKLDPLRCQAISRNGWNANDLNVELEDRYDGAGHDHGERNSFSLYALGRAWSCPPGYHVTISDVQSQVLIQESDLSTTDASGGYIGTSPSSAFQAQETVDANGGAYLAGTSSRYGGPFAGVLVDVTEEPGKLWTWFAGDASSAYNYGSAGNRLGSDDITTTTTDGPTPFTETSRFLPGTIANLIPADQQSFNNTFLSATPGYNTVQYAYRSVFTARGTYPYVIVLDDINKDNTAHNYRWTMACAISFGPSGGRFVNASNQDVYSSLALDPTFTPTATNAVLYHSPVDAGTQAGLPRLLVRDLNGTVPGNNVPATAPAISIDDRPIPGSGATTSTNLTYGYDNNGHTVKTPIPSRRLFMDRPGVATPNYKVLLFPYYTGGLTPTTSWNAAGSVLTVQVGTQTDTITFDYSNPDHRTRIASFVRNNSGTAAPTITLPSNIVVTASGYDASGNPVAPVTYTATAKDHSGNALSPSYSIPSGSSFPVGVTSVVVSATDSAGEESTATFSVTVNPSAPQVSVVNILNTNASNNGVTLTWPYIANVTGYNVKRATQSGGPYTTISSNLPPAQVNLNTTFTDSGLSGATYYYVVTALYNGFESANSNQISLVPATAPLTAQAIGLTTGTGAYSTGNGSYLLYANTPSGTTNDINGSSDSAPALLTPWTGDGTFTARLNNVQIQGGQYEKLGIAFRASNAANAPESFIGYGHNTPSPVGALFFNRTLSGSYSKAYSTFTTSTPGWYRLVRAGSVYSGYYSTDGVNWTLAAAPVTETLTQPGAAGVVGLMIASATSNLAISGSFDNVVFLATPIATSGNATVGLNWTESIGAASYVVGRSLSASGPFNVLASGLTGTTYTDNAVTNLTKYYYTVTALSTSGSSTISPVVSAMPAVLPAPIVTATPGNTQITLNWPTVTGAATYNVSKSTVTGGPYTTVTGLTGTSYLSSSLANGTPYYYVVTAVTSSGTAGAPSAEVAAVPVNWVDQDIGGPTPAGSASYATGLISINGGGVDIWNTSDSFNYFQRAWTGDGVWIAHVSSLTNTNAWAKAGVVFRATLDPAAQNETLVQSESNGVSFQSRVSAGGSTTNSTASGAIPNWVKLDRVGNSFTAYTSADGQTWTTAGSVAANTITGPGYVGLGVTSRSNGTICTGTFDHSAFIATPTTLATGTLTNVSVGLAWTPNPGANITDATATQLEYSPTGANTWTVVVANLAANATSYTVNGLSPSTGYDFRVKSLAGNLSSDYALLSGVTTNQFPPPPLAPSGLVAAAWDSTVDLHWNASGSATGYNVLRATTSGGPFTAIASNLPPPAYTNSGLTDGTTYYYVVQASNSGGASPNTSAVSATPLANTGANQWTSQDIGSVGFAGSSSYSAGTYTIAGSGADIWGGADAFQYDYQALTGDGCIIAQVPTEQNTSTYAKAGVMMRNTLDANSAEATMLLNISQAGFQYRLTAGGSTNQTTSSTSNKWVMLARTGNNFIGYTSPDGVTWTQVGTTQTITMNPTIYVGLAVSAHNNAALNTSTFSSVAIVPTAAWSSQDIGSPSVAGFTSYSGSTQGALTVSASGADIWGTSDQFRYTYQTLAGNGSMTVRVDGIQNINQWSKAGVMIRESTAANSSYAAIYVSPGQGISFQWRNGTGASANDTATSGLYAPYWLRLTRSGNLFSSYTSVDGVNWVPNTSQTITMATTVYIGLAVTSHNASVSATADFDAITTP